MRVQSQEEDNGEMMRVPERLKRLLTDTMMGGGVHQKHAEQHDVSGDTANLSVVDLDGSHGTNLSDLHIVKVDVMRSGVDDGKDKHGVGELAMHPDVFVQRDEPDLGADESHDGPAYRQQNEHAIDAKHQSSTTGEPDGVLECVQTSETDVGGLLPPSIGKDSPTPVSQHPKRLCLTIIKARTISLPVKGPEQKVEKQLRSSELLLDEFHQRHLDRLSSRHRGTGAL